MDGDLHTKLEYYNDNLDELKGANLSPEVILDLFKYACEDGKYYTAQVLLNKGASQIISRVEAIRLLTVACKKGYYGTVDLLIDSTGLSLLDVCETYACKINTYTAKHLISNRSDKSVIHDICKMLCKNDEWEILQYLYYEDKLDRLNYDKYITIAKEYGHVNVAEWFEDLRDE